MSSKKREARKKAQILRNNAVVRQFKKVQRKTAHMQPKADSGQPKTITGQPRPVTTTFEKLRERAMLTPMIDANIEALNPDVVFDRHTKAIDYNSSYIIGITLLCALHDKFYFWYVQAVMVSKATGKNVKLQLLSKRNLEAMLEAMAWATAGLGQPKIARSEKLIDGLISWIPFTRKEYDELLLPFRELTYLADAPKSELEKFSEQVQEAIEERCACGKLLSEQHDCYLGL